CAPVKRLKFWGSFRRDDRPLRGGTRRRSDRGRGLLVLPPATEHGDCVKHSPVVCGTAAMLLEQPIHPLAVQHPEFRNAGRCPRLASEVVKAAHEPIGERKLETDLAL